MHTNILKQVPESLKKYFNQSTQNNLTQSHHFGISLNYRLAYAVKVIDEIVADVPEGVKLHVIYDIACKLSAHFKVS